MTHPTHPDKTHIPLLNPHEQDAVLDDYGRRVPDHRFLVPDNSA